MDSHANHKILFYKLMRVRCNIETYYIFCADIANKNLVSKCYIQKPKLGNVLNRFYF